LKACAGTRVRAFESGTGEELWQWKLPLGDCAPPGRQYVVIAATSGGKLGPPLSQAGVAFADSEGIGRRSTAMNVDRVTEPGHTNCVAQVEHSG
jgi:hypothetical protein